MSVNNISICSNCSFFVEKLVHLIYLLVVVGAYIKRLLLVGMLVMLAGADDGREHSGRLRGNLDQCLCAPKQCADLGSAKSVVV